VILSRTFHRGEDGGSFEDEVAKLREAERDLARRTPTQIDDDARRIAGTIRAIASGVGASA